MIPSHFHSAQSMLLNLHYSVNLRTYTCTTKNKKKNVSRFIHTFDKNPRLSFAIEMSYHEVAVNIFIAMLASTQYSLVIHNSPPDKVS